MKTVLHKAETRGSFRNDWLYAKHSFSFGNYFDPNRIQFGALRVLNDDMISGGKGFGTHPHDNMEIITIPLKGELAHTDSMQNSETIKAGEIQVMSAGTGVSHSEYNASKDQEINLLQIWVIPKERNVKPRYDQIKIDDIKIENSFYQILSPNPNDQGVWIHQDAWFFLGEFSNDMNLEYTLQKEGNGVYIFVIEGSLKIDTICLEQRDGLGIWETNNIHLTIQKNTQVLLMEVPFL